MTPPESILHRRWRKFRSFKRGWYSFLLLVGALLLTTFNPLLINDQALVVRHDGRIWFPAMGQYHEAKALGQRQIGGARYRELQVQYEREGAGDWVIMPPYPYHPDESLLRDPTLPGSPPHAPSAAHWMGTDDRGRDVFARLVYGFRISMLFGLGAVAISYTLGVSAGACLGYFGGRTDMIGQRLVEVWAGLPFLYTVIIVSSILRPSPLSLMVLLALFSWVGISFYVRGEFYREKSRDYVAAAIVNGEGHGSIVFRHILPNALTPIISLAPFALVGAITSLVGLDFLGFGLPPPTASWGELVRQGLDHVTSDDWHLVVFPLGALFLTLLLVVFIGEAIREAFDPRTFSRLR